MQINNVLKQHKWRCWC